MHDRRPWSGLCRLVFQAVCALALAAGGAAHARVPDGEPADRSISGPVLAVPAAGDSAAPATPRTRTAYDRGPWIPPGPRAAVVAPPPIVKILRRGGHGKPSRAFGTATPAAVGGSAAAVGSRAAQAVMVANAADIVRLCRWLL